MKHKSSNISFCFYTIISVILAWAFSIPLNAQIREEDEFERMLLEEVEVENPVYKPVIGFGIGNLAFYGDINDYYRFILGSEPGIILNVSSFIDNKRLFKVNFFFIGGKLTGNERSFNNLDRNLNFESDILNLGVNLEYGFGHFLRPGRLISPFISVGIGTFQFSSKGDLFDDAGNKYFYWNDGTIRNIAQNSPLAYSSTIISRDFNFETDLRGLDLYGLGSYAQFDLAIPVNVGVDFKVTDRINMRVGTSLHYTFSDFVDNLTQNGTPIKGNNRNDWFGYSYVTFNLDLFSDPKTRVIEKLFAMQEFDYTTVEDEDNDGIFDFYDRCPGTPFGEVVNEAGCPADTDGDGIPDFMDRELNTRQGAFIDKFGAEVTDDHLITLLAAGSDAINRNELHLYATANNVRYSRYAGIANLVIPPKFKFVDLNTDGYLSFDELLKAIDNFFDFSSPLTTEDIHELNDFFFAQ